MIAPGSQFDFVIDHYPDISIKYDEHHCRAGSGVIRVCILSGDQKLPLQWKKFLRSSDNKKAFLHFLADEWSRQSYVSAQLTDSKVMFVNDNELCYRLQRASDGTILREEISALECNHAEADTRLILHAAHAGNSGHRCIIIKSPDTDVAVLAIVHRAQINGKALFLTGTKHRHRYVNISHIASHLGPLVCNSLLGMYTLTGCDTTSAFAGKGKVQGLKLSHQILIFSKLFSLLDKTLFWTSKHFSLSKQLYVHCMVIQVTI